MWVSVFFTCMNEIFQLRWFKLILMLKFKIMLWYETMCWVMLVFCEPYWIAVWVSRGFWVSLHAIRSGKISTKLFIVTFLFLWMRYISRGDFMLCWSFDEEIHGFRNCREFYLGLKWVLHLFLFHVWFPLSVSIVSKKW